MVTEGKGGEGRLPALPSWPSSMWVLEGATLQPPDGPLPPTPELSAWCDGTIHAMQRPGLCFNDSDVQIAKCSEINLE